jgi:hypothetical protein
MLGIRDVFAVLVPGAALLLLLDVAFEGRNHGAGIEFLAFAIVAYLVGSVAFAIGSFLDPLAAKVNAWFFRKVPVARHLVGAATIDEVREEGKTAARLSRQILESAAGEGWRHDRRRLGHAKGFWWNQLRLNSPAAIAELDRLESIQKLFRSLFVILLAAILIHAFLLIFDPRAHMPVAGRSASVRGSRFALYSAPAAILSFVLYVRARWRFDATVYRLAAAFMLAPHTLAVARRNLPPSTIPSQLGDGEA